MVTCSKRLINLCPKQLNKLVGRRAANVSPHLSLNNWPDWTILGHKRFTNLPENCIQKYPQWVHFFTSTLSFQKVERYLKPSSQTILKHTNLPHWEESDWWSFFSANGKETKQKNPPITALKLAHCKSIWTGPFKAPLMGQITTIGSTNYVIYFCQLCY